jgi:hypothetical protein
MKCKECGSESGEIWGHFDCPLCRACLKYFEKRIDEICLNVSVRRDGKQEVE